MVLTTIQPLCVFETLQATGHFACTFSRFTEGCEHLEYAYRWLINQMRKRIGGNANYPIWAWTKCGDDYHRWNTPGETYVRIDFNVDPKKVVVSSFDKWNIILNNGPIIDLINDDWDLYDQTYDQIMERGQEAIESTWEKVFDIEEGELTQATLWELNTKDIISSEIFVSTPYEWDGDEEDDNNELDN